MARANGITRATAEATIAAVNAALAAGHPLHGGRGGQERAAPSVAGEALGLSPNAVRQRLNAIRRAHPDLKVDEGLYVPRPAPQPPSLDESVALHRANSAASHARVSLSEAHREIARLQDRLKDLEWAANASVSPAEWTLPSRRTDGGEHMPYLLTSDFQIGEVIRPEETDNAHGYSTDIFRARYRRLIDATIRICAEHTGSSWRFPGIIYARAGDTISGAIHEELAQTDDLTPIQACEVAFEEEAAGIHKLLDAFGRVDVKDAGGGNHDRSTMRPQSKRAHALSYDRLVSFMLRREFRRDGRVTFQATESPDVFFPIYGQNILLTHGDKIGSRGGMGFIGPVATIARGAQKVIMEQQALGRRVDRVDMGHFHTPSFLEWLTCNGCLPGYSEYAKMNRLRPSPPSQFLIFHHPRFGAVDYRLIKLEEPGAAPLDAARSVPATPRQRTLPARKIKPKLINTNARSSGPKTR